MITIQIDTSAVKRQLGDFDASALKPAMHQSVLLIEGKMKAYPSPPSGSSYSRTGTLGRRWLSKVTAGPNELTGTIGNNTGYGPFVQAKGFQASVHRGRWQTEVDTLETSVPDITSIFENAASKALGG